MSGLLLRDVSGYLAHHIANDATYPFSTADWGPTDNVSFSLVGGELRCTTSGASIFRSVRYNALASRARVMVQVVCEAVSTGADIGAAIRADDNTNPDDHIIAQIAAGFSGAQGIVEQVGGTTTASDISVSALSANTKYRASLWADGAAAVMRHFSLAVTRSITLAAGLTSGKVGVRAARGSAGSSDYSEFYVMTDRYVRVAGLPSGYKAQVLTSADVLIAEATESGGTATVDLLAATFPQPAKVRVLNGSGGTEATFTPTGGVGADLVWGGDELTFYPDTVSDSTFQAFPRPPRGTRDPDVLLLYQQGKDRITNVTGFTLALSNSPMTGTLLLLKNGFEVDIDDSSVASVSDNIVTLADLAVPEDIFVAHYFYRQIGGDSG